MTLVTGVQHGDLARLYLMLCSQVYLPSVTIRAYYCTPDYTPDAGPFICLTCSFHNWKLYLLLAFHLFCPVGPFLIFTLPLSLQIVSYIKTSKPTLCIYMPIVCTISLIFIFLTWCVPTRSIIHDSLRIRFPN